MSLFGLVSDTDIAGARVDDGCSVACDNATFYGIYAATTQTGTTSRTMAIFEESETKSGITTSSTTESSMMIVQRSNEERSNYGVIFGAFWNFGDLYSCSMFTMILVLISSYLWYFEERLVIVAHFSGNIITMILISKWYNQCICIFKGIQKYDWILITMSWLAPFYASIEFHHDQNYFICQYFLCNSKKQDYFRSMHAYFDGILASIVIFIAMYNMIDVFVQDIIKQRIVLL